MTNAITDLTNDALWTLACQGMASLQLSQALKAADELCRRAALGDVCPDMLPLPSRTPLAGSYSAEQLQPLTDRVEMVNGYVAAR